MNKGYQLNKPISFIVDLAGIEPASENLSKAVSSIIVFILTFPPSGV